MTPGAAMQLHDERERPCAARLEETSEQRPVPVAEIFNVLYVEIVIHECLGFHDLLLSILTHHCELPGKIIDTFRRAFGDDEGVAEEDAEHTVGGDGVGLDHQNHAGLKFLLELFCLEMIRKDVRRGAYEVDAVNVNGTRLHTLLAVEAARFDQLLQLMTGARHGHHPLEAG